VAILEPVPRAGGWWRTRWSRATLAVEWQARRGLPVAAETVRRWLHALGWVWKRATLAATEDDPQWVGKLARMRYVCEYWPATAARVFADELDINRLPKVGYHGMPRGEQGEGRTPATTETRSLAGAWDMRTGPLVPRGWWRKPPGLFLDLLPTRERTYPASQFTRLDVVVDTYKIDKAHGVAQWLGAHPRLELLVLPTYGPEASPSERAFGDVHDTCTRNHKRKRLWALVRDVEQPLILNGPWHYELSELDDTPEVTAAVQVLLTADTAQEEISQRAA
jgi:DDE superfamily endonuclease